MMLIMDILVAMVKQWLIILKLISSNEFSVNFHVKTWFKKIIYPNLRWAHNILI